MPGAPHPILDTWAPAQFVFGAGASGPERSPDTDTSTMNSTSQSYDTTLHWKLAGTIVGALVIVFALQALGFKFVVAGSLGG